MLEIEDLGVISFEKAYIYQKECVEEVRNRNILGKLLLLEHTDCITAGVSTTQEEIDQIKKFVSLSISVIKTDRGGKITAHNPGQLTGYPIINLKLAKLSVKEFIETVLLYVSKALDYFKLTTKVIIEGNKTGLWIEDRKICFLGIKIVRYITYHGFTLNVNNNLSIFNYFTPCGIENCYVTSMQKELGRKVDINHLKQKIGEIFLDNFGMKVTESRYE